MYPTFDERLASVHEHSRILVYLAPRLLRFPGVIQKYDEPFFPFSRAIIQSTHDIVAGYIFDLAAYLAIGAAGAIALERAAALAPIECIKVLHGPFGTPDYAKAAYESNFAFDAVTVTEPNLITSYTRDGTHGVFVADYGTLPHSVDFGAYWVDSGSITTPLNGGLAFAVTPESLLYTEPGEDFAERFRDKVMKMRHA